MDGTKASFAIMGSGGVGGFFGARLARAGFPTTFVARGAHLKAMRDRGLAVEAPGESFTLPVAATDDPATIGPVDFVLFSVKLWDTESAAEACRPLIGPDTAVLSLQNGVDSEERIAAILGAQHVLGGVAEISAAIAEPGLIRCVSAFQRIRFGELDGRASARCERLDAALTEAGIDHARPADIQAALWTKFIMLVGLSALTAVTRRTVGEVRADPDTRALLLQVMTETLAVGKAGGVALDDGLVEVLAERANGLGAHVKASMALDLERGNRLELPWLSGKVVALGKALGVPTPANGFVYAALKLHQDGTPKT
ncbi:ketopantoate reductase [Tistlia consotensis]|uniref:2-dehydropantoate 2-reductase n=1 Tax=Tistlia consotensis USBA 355 TaxID=560819 RepID=A0A1Y6C5H5_9PROT|nr:2-dehydropantoate 2-reductase [Tistlia consotensis]SMF35633.1 ketopantoate reductase [Tistlia consotensis USBA 355]SNR71065.1 ketopantoate reductase [Tistlia consotensis]